MDFQSSWIALISRQQLEPSANCTFDIKVQDGTQHLSTSLPSHCLMRRETHENHLPQNIFLAQVMHAQLAGAAAAIVYDNVYESLILMSKPPGHDDPSSPAVFINQHSGFILSKLLEVDGNLSVQIMPVCPGAGIWGNFSEGSVELGMGFGK